jgi:hypothetical protein
MRPWVSHRSDRAAAPANRKVGWWATASAAIFLAAGCPGNGKTGGTAAGGTTFTLFALAEVRGQIEPCGCTTDPLGDLARTAQLVAEARTRGPTVVVDAGSLLYTQAPLPEHLRDQEELKADLLARVYKEELEVAGLGLGPLDLATGPSGTRIPRLAANVPAGDKAPALEAPKLVKVGAESIGVFGVIDPAQVPALGATDPVAAAKRSVADLRERGAARVVGLATMSRKDAVALVRAVPGIDVMVVGLGTQAPEPKDVHARAEQIGDTWMVFPANRGQVVSRFEITLRPGGGALVDAVGEAAAADRRAELDERVKLIDSELAVFAKDPSADPAFVAQHKAERDRLAAERDELATSPLRTPAKGSYFQLAQVRIQKSLACDGEVVGAKQAYARAAGEANVAGAKTRPPIAVPAGAATYVGTEACTDCHAEAGEFWKTSRHAGAWETLEKVSKQFDYDCIGCHTTGWNQPGGASMAANETLRDVQCETCHGPGSRHVDADEADAKKTIRLAPPPELCASQCHTPEHSDTFERTAYLRDIIGPGHGEKARAILGSGPTGRELRAAGLAKAGKAIGAGCPK